jgi:hypothetical protein
MCVRVCVCVAPGLAHAVRFSHASPARVDGSESNCVGFLMVGQLSEYRRVSVRLGAPHHEFFCTVVPTGSRSHISPPLIPSDGWNMCPRGIRWTKLPSEAHPTDKMPMLSGFRMRFVSTG